MAETTSRILSLLTLLQAHRQWTGSELADRLAVTERTLRRDIERVRELGYRVEAARGPAGGYRLEAGSQLPPLLLTEDEAVTMAIGLRLAVTQGLVDGELTTQSALAKFEQVLPSTLRHRVNALASHVSPQSPRGAPVSQEMVGSLALACRDSERIRFHYVAGDGAETDRVVEPHTLVAALRNWFLVCWDLQRAEWRTFRVDRMSRLFPTRVRFAPRELPTEDAAEFVAAAVRGLQRRFSAEVEIRMPLAAVQEALGRWAEGALALDETTTVWHIDAESPEHLLGALAWIPRGTDYTVAAGADMLEFLGESAIRMSAATRTPSE
jgi:predicted DNA-binding transcriptional regulator YafY